MSRKKAPALFKLCGIGRENPSGHSHTLAGHTQRAKGKLGLLCRYSFWGCWYPGIAQRIRGMSFYS